MGRATRAMLTVDRKNIVLCCVFVLVCVLMQSWRKERDS